MNARDARADPRDALAAAVARGATAAGVRRDTALVLAVSGGPDSMALLHGAARLLESDAVRWRLSVAHLDHGLRDDSPADAEFVARAAEALGLSYHVGRADVAALARAGRSSIEQAGRDARYRFLHEVAGEERLVATAHTLDDSVETVLLNLLRGSGLAGVGGIPARRDRIVRPLLAERRARLRALLDAGAIEYREDPSNADPAFARNRIRAELLPVLEDHRPGAVERIARFSRLAAEDDALLDALAGAELDRRRGPDGTLDWRNPPVRALGRRILRAAVGDPAPTAERIEALLDAAGGDHGGVRIELGGGRAASVAGRRVTLE